MKHIADIGVGREAAAALIALTTGGLSMAVGPKALMLESEREQIEPPLGRMLARLSPQAAVLVASFADPIMLGVGLVAYLTRVLTPDAPKQPAAAPGSPVATRPANLPPVPTQAPTVPPATNGVALFDNDAALFSE